MVTALIIIILVIAVIALCYWAIFKDSVEIDPKAPFYDDEFETEGTHHLKIKQND